VLRKREVDGCVDVASVGVHAYDIACLLVCMHSANVSHWCDIVAVVGREVDVRHDDADVDAAAAVAVAEWHVATCVHMWKRNAMRLSL